MKALKTKNGNLLVAAFNKDGELNTAAYFTKQLKFIRYPEEQHNEWDWALHNWREKPFEIAADEDPFPYVRSLGDVKYIFYKKGHSKAGIIQRLISDEDRVIVLTADEAICLKKGEIPLRRTQCDIERGEYYYRNLKASEAEITERRNDEKGDAEKHIDAYGVDKFGYVVGIHYACDKTSCSCVGGWWEGEEDAEKIFYF